MFVPYATIQNWVEAGGEKAPRRIHTDYLDWAFSDFSGYIAADELYDGPFCILSIVDNRTFKRLTYQVLDHDPTHVDIEAFFRRFRQALEARGLTLQGITTDGSSLYPEPIAAVFGEVPHQVCQFHVLHEVNKAVLSAVAQDASVWPPAPPNCRGAVPARRRPSVPPGARSGSSRRSASCSSTATCSSSSISARPSGRPCSGSAAACRNSAACAG